MNKNTQRLSEDVSSSLLYLYSFFLEVFRQTIGRRMEPFDLIAKYILTISFLSLLLSFLKIELEFK